MKKHEFGNFCTTSFGFAIEEVKKNVQRLNLQVAQATMVIAPSYYCNITGQYDITQLIISHNILGLVRFAKNNTIRHPRATVDIIIEWKENL